MTDRAADPRPTPAARDFDFAEACALLGGAPATDPRLARGAQWLFAGDARWPLEVLRLELCLFLDVCARVAELPAAARASAALAPDAVRVAVGDGSGAPARWRLRAEVASGGGAAPGGAATELPALGGLLLQALLVDDAQDLGAVVATVDACLRRLEAERLDLAASCARWPQLLAGKELRGCCASTHVLHRASDRKTRAQLAADERPLVPNALWEPLLVAAGRALATWAPFAFVPAADALPQLVAAVEAVVARLDDELFHADARDAAVAAACAEVAEQLRAGVPPLAGAVPAQAPVPGFRMLVRRDGDAQSQELRYEIDRVTIGRREGENLLRLNDPMVSSMHAVIEITPDGWVVFDRNSTNGTEVDGIRLPVEVPQPLQEGSVIVIRPFRLTFHTLVPTQAPKPAARALDAASLRDRLHEAHARERVHGSVRVHEALLAVLAAAGGEFAPELLLRCVDELARTAAPAPGVAAGGGQDPLEVAAARALLQLSRSLLGAADFATVEQVQLFAGKLGRFVDATAHWIERMLELRKALGRHLDLGQVSTGGGRTPVRSAADVRTLVAGWQSDAPAVDAAAWYVAKFFDDVVAILVGLLEVNQQVRKAVRERLDPARLADIAGRAAAARAQVQAAMASPLWQEYVQAFEEVTGSGADDAEFAQLLQRVAALQTQRS